MLTVTGNEDEIVNTQSRHLDIERINVVKQTFHPINLVCCAILELRTVLGTKDLIS